MLNHVIRRFILSEQQLQVEDVYFLFRINLPQIILFGLIYIFFIFLPPDLSGDCDPEVRREIQLY